MSLEWWHLVVGFIGTNGITYYLARPKKNSLEIENFKKLFDEAQEERENMKALYSSYEVKTECKIKELETKLNNMEKRYNRVLRATNTAYRCPYPQSVKECPVIKTLEEESCKVCGGNIAS